ncbi:phosphomannomutase [Marinomonas epiphytica]
MSVENSFQVKTLSDELGVAFGTSGVRGLVEDLTPELCFAFTLSFLQSVCPEKKEVAVGIDLRPSSPSIAKAVIRAIEARGAKAIYCGELPTPALAFYAMQHAMPAVMITGSHIPFDRNGIKFYRPDGEISKADEVAIMSGNVSLVADLHELENKALPEAKQTAMALFEQRYIELFPENVLAGKRVGVYEHSSVARDVIKKLLKYFGAEVVSLERTDTFVPIDTEAVSEEDAIKGRTWSQEYKLDAIVSTDGDGDRPLISDENGEWLRGDIVGVLCADYLKATHVAAPVNVNTVLELSDPERVCLRTKIGSPYVIAGMGELANKADLAKVVGYEANGGFLVGSDLGFGAEEKTLKALPTRDSVLPIMIVLAMAAQQGKVVSELLRNYPARYTASDRIKETPTKLSQNYLSALKESSEKQDDFLSSIYLNEGIYATSINTLDGLRMTLSNNDIVHLRPSGNAPELRCYVEAGVSTEASKIVEVALKSVVNKLTA